MPKVNKLLQQAIDNLSINDVYLHEAQSCCNDGFDPKATDDVAELIIQQMHVVAKSELVETSGEVRLLRVFIRLGVRWVAPDEEDETDVKALIEADFVAEYQMSKDLEAKCIDEFSLKNASFHVWPYWREYLSSQCERMRLPRIILPVVQFNKQSEQDSKK